MKNRDRYGWFRQESAEEVMGYNRKERRRIGKLNKVKIPGTNKPFNKKQWEKENKRDDE